MTLETMAPLSEDPIFKLPAVAACQTGKPAGERENTAALHHPGTTGVSVEVYRSPSPIQV
jgi:hypothetical protein